MRFTKILIALVLAVVVGSLSGCPTHQHKPGDPPHSHD